MSTDMIIGVLQLLTGATLIFGTVFLLFSLVAFRHSRRDAFWRYRRQAGQRGFRFTMISIFFFAISAAFCVIALSVSFVESDSRGEVAVQPSATPTSAAPTAMPTPSVSPPPAATESESTQTAEPSPTIIASPTLPALATDANITLTGIDDAISPEWTALEPDTQFAAGTKRFYFFLRYGNLDKNDLWGRTLLKDGEILYHHESLWGILPPEGETFFFFGNGDGFEPGTYEIRVTLGEEQILLASAQFTVGGE